MQEYADAWDYLYEPSRYLARAYRYYLAMRPSRRIKRWQQGDPRTGKTSPTGVCFGAGHDPGYCHNSLAARGPCVVPASVLDPIDRDGWQNPSRLVQYFTACVMGEDLAYMRQVVREKVAAIIKER